MSTGPQGPQGSPGFGDSVGRWSLSIASGPSDDQPASGVVKLYVAGSSAMIAFNSATSTGIDMSPAGILLTNLDKTRNAFVTLSQVDDPVNFITVDVSSSIGPYSVSGGTSFSITGSIHGSGGALVGGVTCALVPAPHGAQGLQGHPGAQGLQGHPGDSPLGPQGAQGPQGFLGEGSLTWSPVLETYGPSPGYIQSIYRGVQGPQGHPAAAAPQGNQGVQGLGGGPQGDPGHPGEPGPQGGQGSPIMGYVGPIGESGATGAPGPTGYQGQSTGYQGSAGPPGVQGTPGDRGAQGAQGTGSQGSAGVIGEYGNPGHPGILGIQGVQGIQGIQGIQGTFGFIGNQGPQGNRGHQGSSGPGFIVSKTYNSDAERAAATGGDLPGDGEFGLVAGTLDPSDPDYGRLYLYTTLSGWSYQADISVNGLIGSQGPQGDVGQQGHQGIQSAYLQGSQGVQGAQGSQGDVGHQGAQGIDPTSGPQGIQGTQGIQGHPGQSSSPSGNGLLYSSGGTLEVVSLYGLGLEVSGTSGNRVLTLGQQRPALDSNHIHVYNCDDAIGSSVLTDTGSGAKNATLYGGERVSYNLQDYTSGGKVPYVRGLSSLSTTPAYTDNTCNVTGGSITLECVVKYSVWDVASGVFIEAIGTTVNDKATLYVHPSSTLVNFTVFISGTSYFVAYGSSASNGDLRMGTACHLMGVLDPSEANGSKMKLYINGVLVSTDGTGGTNPGTSTVAGGNRNPGSLATMKQVYIGGSQAGTGSARCNFRDIRISNVARSAAYALEMTHKLCGL